MARIELDIDDKGEIVGDVPEALKGIFTRIENTAHTAGFGKGNAKAAEEAKAQIASAVSAAKADMEREAPIRAEKFAAMEGEHKSLQKRLLDQEQEHTRTLSSIGEKHARELLDRADAIKKRNERVEELTLEALKAEARSFGALDNMLDDVATLLRSHVGFDDDMRAYVRNPDGSPKTVQGKPQTLSAFVKEFLDSKPSFRKAPAPAGGSARGGASMHGHQRTTTSVEAASARIDGGDRSLGAIHELILANREKAKRSAS
jgi:hypothetical protein